MDEISIPAATREDVLYTIFRNTLFSLESSFGIVFVTINGDVYFDETPNQHATEEMLKGQAFGL